jgi:hypothetical protein
MRAPLPLQELVVESIDLLRVRRMEGNRWRLPGRCQQRPSNIRHLAKTLALKRQRRARMKPGVEQSGAPPVASEMRPYRSRSSWRSNSLQINNFQHKFLRSRAGSIFRRPLLSSFRARPHCVAIPGVPLHFIRQSPDSKTFCASGAPAVPILTYLRGAPQFWEPKIHQNCQFHNTLSLRNLLRMFMGSTISQISGFRSRNP